MQENISKANMLQIRDDVNTFIVNNRGDPKPEEKNTNIHWYCMLR